MTEKTHPRRKILMLIPQLGYGGAETYFVRLSNLFARHHDVTIALFTRYYGIGYAQRGLEPKSSIIILDQGNTTSSRMKRWINRWQKLRALKQESDLVISFLTGPNILNAFTKKHDKTIVTIVGSRTYNPHIKKPIRLLYKYIIDPITYLLADTIVSVSRGLINELPNFISPKINYRSKIIEILIDAEQMVEKTLGDVEPEMCVLKGQPVIVASGRLSIEKGFQPLIDIFSEITKQISNAKLLIIGDGPLRESLEEQCASLNLPINCFDKKVASIILTGYRDNPIRYFKLGSIFVLSSLTEGFSNSLVEGLASGIPVMAANTPWGVRSVLYDDPPDVISPFPTEKMEKADYGILMPRIDLPCYKHVWIDGLQKVLSNPAEYADLAKRGPDRVRQLDERIIGRKWLDLVNEVCAHDAQSSV